MSVEPRNRKFVVKHCLNCGEEFGTYSPWQKHCSYKKCAYPYMKRLQAERRAKQRESRGDTRLCMGCRKLFPELPRYYNHYRRKGVCEGCLAKLEAMEYSKPFAYRLGYLMDIVKDMEPASRQGRA